MTRLLECSGDDLRVRGAAITYRLHDIGYAIDLEHVTELLISEAPERARPERIEARALQIANPPVAVRVGMREIGIVGVIYTTQLFGRIFDFGVVSLRLEIAGADTTTWGAFVDFARSLAVSRALDSVFAHELEALRERIAPAVERAGDAPVHEEYTVSALQNSACETDVSWTRTPSSPTSVSRPCCSMSSGRSPPPRLGFCCNSGCPTMPMTSSSSHGRTRS